MRVRWAGLTLAPTAVSAGVKLRSPPAPALPMPVTQDQVIEKLKLVADPEVLDREGKPVDIWEMGLVYKIDITAEEPAAVNIQMTLTSQGCPMGQMIQRDVLARVGQIPGVAKTHVEVVWQPQWNPSMMTAAAKQRLGMEDPEGH